MLGCIGRPGFTDLEGYKFEGLSVWSSYKTLQL